MLNLDCPICETKVEISDSVKAKERVTCPNCFAQLQVYKYKGKNILTCAVCADPIFDPAKCDDCERRRERKVLLEEGRL
ncbi:MAG: hypothetical protein QME05_05900 [Candidatus Margulisbacteria bacterium]|nr:hypothetical protein [Candidatus Margulisiibacteriota bacterium]